MNRMRGIWWVLVIGLGLFLGGCKTKKSTPEEAARMFFDLLGNGKAAQAFDSAAFGFQSKQEMQVFEQKAKELGLTDLVSSTWEPADIQDRSAYVRGEVVDRTGAKIPLYVVLVDQSGGWRVFAIKKPRGVATGQAANLFGTLGPWTGFGTAVDLPMPMEQELRDLASETMGLFSDSIRLKSFSVFYESVSRAWKVRLTTGALQRAFQPFIDKQIDLEGVKKVRPTLDPPAYVNTDGFLIISGYYPMKPYRIAFALKYIYELPNWKLFGIDVNVQE
ncbi:MAG: hypothetical protein JWL59_1123 [Chthoniobacteraceae bacterium]|nr:hypothetical protein [Chthoniobacteraceae bacterium]